MDIAGHVEPGWEPVAEAFRRNFVEHNELGAAAAVYAHGRPVVDLWGGIADSRVNRQWSHDTLTVVMSTTKGAAAICVHMLAERGLLDLDAPVADYWPEFAQAGKADITVRLALSHQAGLHFLDADLSFADLQARDPVIRAIERQTPQYRPGSKAEYHAITFGFIAGELVARVTGESIGQFFAEEVAGPLGLDAWIGFDAGQEPRVAYIERDGSRSGGVPDAFKELDAFKGVIKAMTLGSALPTDLLDDETGMNSPALRSIELAAGNMVCDARSIARMYAATVGDIDGVRLLSPPTVAAASEIQTGHLPDPVLPEPFASMKLPRRDYSVGFTTEPSMLSQRSFGFPGAGGSLGFADPEARIGFGYVMNRFDAVTPDIRAQSLSDAVRKVLAS